MFCFRCVLFLCLCFIFLRVMLEHVCVLELALSSCCVLALCVFCVQFSLSRVFSRCLPALRPLRGRTVPSISLSSQLSRLTLIHCGHGKKNTLYTAWHHRRLFFPFLMEKGLTVISTGTVHGTSADRILVWCSRQRTALRCPL